VAGVGSQIGGTHKRNMAMLRTLLVRSCYALLLILGSITSVTSQRSESNVVKDVGIKRLKILLSV
jgi:hypothetical protein